MPGNKKGLINRIKLKTKEMLSLNYSPHKMALACALGMLVGISPYIGLQTYIAVALAALLKVPVYPLIVGVYITNPLTIPFIFSVTTKFGFWLMGKSFVLDFNWNEITLHGLYKTGKSLLVPFILGTHVAGLILSVLTYFLVYFFMKKRQNMVGSVSVAGQKVTKMEEKK